MGITDNNFQKISKLWIFADPIVLMLLFYEGVIYLLYLFDKDKVPFVFLFFVTLFFCPLALSSLLKRFIVRHYFYFSFENDFLIVKENILRGRERKISYDHIENISTKGNLPEHISRIFGLHSLKLFCSPEAEDVYDLNPNINKSKFDSGPPVKTNLKLFLLEVFLTTHFSRCVLGIGSCRRFVIIPGLTKSRFELLKKKVETLIGSRTDRLIEKISQD